MRYYQPSLTQPVSTFVEDKRPWELINSNLQGKQKSYDENLASTQAIEDEFLKVNALTQDTERRNAKLKEYKDALAKQVDETKGDYTRLTPFILNQRRKIKEDLTTGELGAIQNNYNKYVGYVKELDDAHKSDKISEDTKRYLLNRAGAEYTGIGDRQTSGNYNPFNDLGYSKEINLGEEANKLANDWKETQMKSDNWKLLPNGQYYEKTTGKNVDFNEVYNNVYNSLAERSDVKSYLNQEYGKNTWGKDYTYTDPITGEKSSINPDVQQSYFQHEKLGKAAKAAADKEAHTLLDYKNLRNTQIQDDINRNRLKQVKEENTTTLPTIYGTGNEVTKLVPHTDILNDKGTINWEQLVNKKTPLTDWAGIIVNGDKKFIGNINDLLKLANNFGITDKKTIGDFGNKTGKSDGNKIIQDINHINEQVQKALGDYIAVPLNKQFKPNQSETLKALWFGKDGKGGTTNVDNVTFDGMHLDDVLESKGLEDNKSEVLQTLKVSSLTNKGLTPGDFDISFTNPKTGKEEHMIMGNPYPEDKAIFQPVYNAQKSFDTFIKNKGVLDNETKKSINSDLSDFKEFNLKNNTITVPVKTSEGLINTPMKVLNVDNFKDGSKSVTVLSVNSQTNQIGPLVLTIDSNNNLISENLQDKFNNSLNTYMEYSPSGKLISERDRKDKGDPYIENTTDNQ